jgi:hypothetical protein
MVGWSDGLRISAETIRSSDYRTEQLTQSHALTRILETHDGFAH